MVLAVASQPQQLTATGFVFQVPGSQLWAPRSVIITVARAAGGVPNRGYQLQITNGPNVVAASGAQDAGTEPGVCTITWCAASASAVAAGSVGVVVASLPTNTLEPGYLIQGVIVNPAAGDTIETAVVWYDFTYTTPQ